MTPKASLNMALERCQLTPHALGEDDRKAMRGVSFIPFLEGLHDPEVYKLS